MASNGRMTTGRWLFASCGRPTIATLSSRLEQVTGESLKPGDWVEITNLVTELHRQGGQLAQIVSLENVSGGVLVTLDSDIHPILMRRKNGGKSGLDQGLGPRLRRWSGYIPHLAFKNVNDLGRGVKAIFHSTDKKARFEPGDYWTFAIKEPGIQQAIRPTKSGPDGNSQTPRPLAISGVARTGRQAR